MARWRATHDAYLEALLDMGIAGTALRCAYFAHVWKRFRALAADLSLSPGPRGFFLGAAADLLAVGMLYGQRRR